ncbi:hypothetical protein ACLI09_01775 [Flavobacterium sp. RHBU_24]|uniref:hypothetical protein n=1 Tax=Flavobacterium sp. RHBU_24 TaxID=3391185 RepID=UPI003984A00A
MELISVLVLGILMLLMGIILKYIIGKRRFRRRTLGNMEVFKNYNSSLYIPFFEKIVVLFSWLFMLGGVFLIGLWYFGI